MLSGSLTWDRETEKKKEAPNEVTTTFTAIATISYGLTPWMSLTTGIAKGFADTSKGQGMQFADGEWGTGISVGFSTPGLPFFERDSITFSASYEYNIPNPETSVSVDVSFGLSF